MSQAKNNNCQLLRVTLETEDQARALVTSAKYLRKSIDVVIRDKVYINADLTPGKRKTAYE